MVVKSPLSRAIIQRRDMQFTKATKRTLDILYQKSFTITQSSQLLPGLAFLISFLISPHRLSVGLRSGDCVGRHDFNPFDTKPLLKGSLSQAFRILRKIALCYLKYPRSHVDP